MQNKRESFCVYTDLAVEEKESFPGNGGEIKGVSLRESKDEASGISLTEVVIKNKEGERNMGKPVGTYLTLEAEGLKERSGDGHKEVVDELSRMLRALLKQNGICPGKDGGILAVGLGNPDATPDSLGPRVLEKLPMTRHLNMEYGRDFCRENGYPILSGIIPGVMAQNGMETAEILRGIIAETKPAAVLAIDALAARSIHRLGITIQLTDTGIHPGSGVGNHRNGLTREGLGIPVFAIGVPTVVGAAAVVHGTVGAMIEALKKEACVKNYGDYMENMDQEEQYELIREILEPQFGPMYVTPHNIDERVEDLSITISEAIQEALFR